MPMRPPIHRPAGYRTPKQRRDANDQRRGSSAARGYDSDWRKLSIEFRAQHPFCQCDEHKGADERVLSEVVDHIKPIATDPDLRLEWSNLRALAKRCHDRHTARTQGFARGR